MVVPLQQLLDKILAKRSCIFESLYRWNLSELLNTDSNSKVMNNVCIGHYRNDQKLQRVNILETYNEPKQNRRLE